MLCKIVSQRGSCPKITYLENFWTLFKIVSQRGSCPMGSCPARSYCNDKNSQLTSLDGLNLTLDTKDIAYITSIAQTDFYHTSRILILLLKNVQLCTKIDSLNIRDRKIIYLSLMGCTVNLFTGQNIND